MKQYQYREWAIDVSANLAEPVEQFPTYYTARIEIERDGEAAEMEGDAYTFHRIGAALSEDTAIEWAHDWVCRWIEDNT